MAHVILVSAQVLLVLTLGLWTSDLSLTILSFLFDVILEFISNMSRAGIHKILKSHKKDFPPSLSDYLQLINNHIFSIFPLHILHQ